VKDKGKSPANAEIHTTKDKSKDQDKNAPAKDKREAAFRT